MNTEKNAESKAQRLVSALGADKDPAKMETLLENLGRGLTQAVIDGAQISEFQENAALVEAVRAIQEKLYARVSACHSPH